jgi:hypothetical protein
MVRRYTKLSPEARKDLGSALADGYLEGRSVRDLAAEYQASYGFIHRLLREVGAVMRSRGGRNPRK